MGKLGKWTRMKDKMYITFTIPGPPVPKARARVGRCGAFTPQRTKEYEAKVRALALVARQKARQRMWAGPVCLGVRFFVNRPEETPDIDNLIKSITDACSGVIYKDDAQITHLWASKNLSSEPCAIVTLSKDDEA